MANFVQATQTWTCPLAAQTSVQSLDQGHPGDPPSLDFECGRLYLVGGWAQPIWKIWVSGKDYPIYEMENKKCSKPPTSYPFSGTPEQSWLLDYSSVIVPYRLDLVSITGWWLTYPSEKYESQLGLWHSQLNGKNKIHVPNHQPDIIHHQPKCWTLWKHCSPRWTPTFSDVIAFCASKSLKTHRFAKGKKWFLQRILRKSNSLLLKKWP